MPSSGISIPGDSKIVVDSHVNGVKVERGRKRNKTIVIAEGFKIAAIDLVVQRFLQSELQSVEWQIQTMKPHLVYCDYRY